MFLCLALNYNCFELHTMIGFAQTKWSDLWRMACFSLRSQTTFSWASKKIPVRFSGRCTSICGQITARSLLRLIIIVWLAPNICGLVTHGLMRRPRARGGSRRASSAHAQMPYRLDQGWRREREKCLAEIICQIIWVVEIGKVFATSLS